MVILVNPMLSNYRNLNADSCYIVIKNIITAVKKKRNDIWWIIPFPKEKFKYYDDGFFDDEKIIRVPIDLPQRKMDSVVHFNINYWRKFFKIFTPDVIWNHIPEISHLFQNMYTSFDNEKSKPIVFNQHHYVIHPTLPYPIHPYKAVQFCQMGSFLADLNIFNSEYCKKMYYDVRNEIINKSIPQNDTVVKFAFIPTEYPQPKPEKKFVKIAYNHRLQDYKNYLETFEMLAQLYTTHKNFKVIVTNPNASNFNKLLQYPFVEGKAIIDHNAYLGELSTCHLNITNSQHETFCISALESLAFGQILVAPNAITFPELVPPDYKYLFNNDEEQYKILDKLLSDPSIFDKERDRIKNHTREEFANEKIAGKYIELFEQYSKSNFTEDNLKDISKQAISTIVKRNKGKFVELKEIQRQFGEWNLGWQAFPLMKIKRIFNQMGYKDDIKGRNQGIYL